MFETIQRINPKEDNVEYHSLYHRRLLFLFLSAGRPGHVPSTQEKVSFNLNTNKTITDNFKIVKVIY